MLTDLFMKKLFLTLTIILTVVQATPPTDYTMAVSHSELYSSYLWFRGSELDDRTAGQWMDLCSQ